MENIDDSSVANKVLLSIHFIPLVSLYHSNKIKIFPVSDLPQFQCNTFIFIHVST